MCHEPRGAAAISPDALSSTGIDAGDLLDGIFTCVDAAVLTAQRVDMVDIDCFSADLVSPNSARVVAPSPSFLQTNRSEAPECGLATTSNEATHFVSTGDELECHP